MMSTENNQSNHAPGPWSASPYSSVVGSLISSGSRPVGAAFPQSVTAEALANARLIAAAPELLAALKWLYELNATGVFTLPDSDYAAITSAAAAIAKAEGE